MPSPSIADQNRKIFIGGLSYRTTDDTLREYALQFGDITDCLVMKDRDIKSRGFGFITYSDVAMVDDFMAKRPHLIDGRQIDPKRAMPREEKNNSDVHLTVKKLFVAGLRDGITEDILRQYFERYGAIVETIVMKDKDGKPRGFGFVTFDDYDPVDRAILERPHSIMGRQLDVRKAVPKQKTNEDGTPVTGKGLLGNTMDGNSRPISSNNSGSNNNHNNMNNNNSNYGMSNSRQGGPNPSNYGMNSLGGMNSLQGGSSGMYSQSNSQSASMPTNSYNTGLMSYDNYNTNNQQQPPPLPNNNLGNYLMPNISSLQGFNQPPMDQRVQQNSYNTNIGNPNPFDTMSNPSSLFNQNSGMGTVNPMNIGQPTSGGYDSMNNPSFGSNYSRTNNNNNNNYNKPTRGSGGGPIRSAMGRGASRGGGSSFPYERPNSYRGGQRGGRGGGGR
ncbi:unnamed protein product [Didymodactylos carnosus]|uniref:RRM domain-containing protein n=2 Tax=Didymodactylos carnosus TaxID=1234261 RepID=A0A813XFB1_9BILA|nr:unnamed protein product [Didymodactylos carnosus]CAF0872320.1 unnamed protein product [Didymodactylos carnosus]CAF3625826.1 unnamed protein product [Didymodactylos carnosus]CAF3659588.1 unnamed protein product [Didymodactylos carnosus]